MSGAKVGHRGGCLCGAVSYEVEGALRPALVCHCRMCQQTHGVPAAYSAARRDQLRLDETRGLAWYSSSGKARRGFCRECGASLFWEPVGGDYYAIACGTLEQPTGVEIVGHIFVASKGDYYEITDGLPQFEKGTGGQVPQAPSVV
jgi:hypothetical protein